MSYARVPRTVVLVDGLTGTQATALTTAGTEVVARAEPSGLAPTSADRWLAAIASGDPTGGAAGRVIITVFGSHDGATWEHTAGGAAPSAQTITDATTGTGSALFSQDDTGGDNWFARLAVDLFEFYKVEFSGVVEVAPAVTYTVLVSDCKGTL